MEKFYRRSGDDPWVNSLVPNDSNPAKFGHLNTIVDAVTALQEEFIYLKVSLTPDQIQTANSNPIDIGLPPSGVGYYYRVLAFDTNNISGSIAYLPATYLGISSSQVVLNNVWTNSLVFPGLPGTLTVGLLGAGASATSAPNYVENDILVISADDNSPVGDYYMDCYITVQKVKL